MKKTIKLVTILLLLIFLSTDISYAISNKSQQNEFFIVSKSEINAGNTLEMKLNLNKIENKKFKIVLNSNIDSDEIYTNEDITIQNDTNAITIEIDKTKMNLSEITLYYLVPENSSVGTKIQLTAQAITEEENTSENGETVKEEKVILEEKNIVTIIEKSNEDNNENTNQTADNNSNGSQGQNNNNENNNIEKPSSNQSNDTKQNGNIQNSQNGTKQNVDMQNSNTNQKGNMPNTQNMSSQGSSKNSSNMSIGNSSNNKNSSNQVETATYNGSNNNYLKSLKITGVDLNTSFNKENSTYFAKVTDTSKLTIKATAEDDTAKVTIVGNDNIKKGQNKILIAVTAENGNVRYYRIFVNCEEAITNSEQTNTSSKTDSEQTNTLSTTAEVKSALIENVELHATYYLEKVYVEENSYVAKGEKILKYTNGTYLVAPYDCYIVSLNFPELESKCLNSHYVQIQCKNILTVSMNIDETNISKIEVGKEAKLTISSIDKTYTGYVTHIGSTASDGKFEINIEFENDGNVKLGMTSSVQIEI